MSRYISTRTRSRPTPSSYGIAILLIGFLLPWFSGCSTSGGSTVLFPKSNRLLPEARDIAMTIDRCAPLPRELSKQALEAYYIQPGDVLLFEIVDLDADIRLPADQTVMPDGSIDLGEYGRYIVAGMTIEQIEELVHTALQAVEGEEVQPINVRLTLAESVNYYVLGEVNAPGSYPLIGRETVLDAIMAAGGLADNASDCRIILARPTPPCGCRVVLPVCYNQIVQLGDTTTNYQIRPGDRIYVATRTLCEQLRFWSNRCQFCPDCNTGGCPSPLIPTHRPFILEPLPKVIDSETLPQPHPPTNSSPGELPVLLEEG